VWSFTRRLLETIQACLLDLADLITEVTCPRIFGPSIS
jgi:hypothetical protein